MKLSPDEQEHFDERAAIIEFEANKPREEAERLAMLDVLAARKVPA